MSNLLQENGDALLQEIGDNILIDENPRGYATSRTYATRDYATSRSLATNRVFV